MRSRVSSHANRGLTGGLVEITRFLTMPNLPENPVVSVVLDERYAGRFTAALKGRGAEVILCPKDPCLSSVLCGHPDMQLHHVGGSRFYISQSCTLQLPSAEFIYAEKRANDQYPNDILLNAAAVGKSIFLNTRYADKGLLTFYQNGGYEIIDIHQGYAKCNICVVDEHSIISSDTGIAKEAEKHGIECLLIKPGHISLPGYEYGFIGGATGKLGKKRMAFTGNPERHPDGKRILDFLAVRGISSAALTEDICTDIGGIIPIYEACE